MYCYVQCIANSEHRSRCALSFFLKLFLLALNRFHLKFYLDYRRLFASLLRSWITKAAHDNEFLQIILIKLTGTNNNDYLLGESGNDLLTGGLGTDTLYGGDDLDRLDGGDNADTLFGGAGSDVLIGGSGDDTLYGGLGHDTYLINAGEGQDHIIDDDRQGTFILGGVSLTGLYYLVGSQYQSADGQLSFTPGASITVNGPSGTSVVIDNFQAGDYGIHYSEQTRQAA